MSVPRGFYKLPSFEFPEPKKPYWTLDELKAHIGGTVFHVDGGSGFTLEWLHWGGHAPDGEITATVMCPNGVRYECDSELLTRERG